MVEHPVATERAPLTYYEPEMGFVRQPNGKSLDKEAHAPRTPIAPGTPALQ